MIAVCDWLNAPSWLAVGLPVLIVAGVAIGWIVRLVKWAGRRTVQQP